MATNLNLNCADFKTKVLESDVPVLVDFWAPWCGPCLHIGPFVEEIANEVEGKAKVFKVDVDQCGDIGGEYGIMSIPQLIVFKGGKEVERHSGAAPKATLKALIERHF